MMRTLKQDSGVDDQIVGLPDYQCLCENTSMKTQWHAELAMRTQTGKMTRTKVKSRSPHLRTIASEVQ